MKTYKLTREIPVEKGYDIVVAGGGPAGSAAAICAARLGAKVLLVEATGCLGGMGTSGLVTTFGPMSDGDQMLTKGYAAELIDRMHERGFLGPQVIPDFWKKHDHRWTPFKPEGLKLVLDEFALGAGVELRFFSRVIDADAGEKEVKGLIINNVEGYSYIVAKAFVDATGDACLAHLCGVLCLEAGLDTPKMMPATLCSLYGGINWNHPVYGEDYRSLEAVKSEVRDKLLPQAIEDGHFSQTDRFMPGMSKIGESIGALNGGHIFNLNALRCKDLTDGMILGRKLALEYMEFYRKYVPGCRDIEHVTTASLMGVRDSRRIVGEYRLTIDDFRARRQFHDQIGVYNRPTDVHPYDDSEAEYQRFQNDVNKVGRLGKGECYGIPYGVLVPRGWRNLWVAGRCLSCDTKIHGSVRAMPAAAMMGQAAGTAAVQSIQTGQAACALDTSQLIESLKEAGVYLPQKKAVGEMTRTTS